MRRRLWPMRLGAGTPSITRRRSCSSRPRHGIHVAGVAGRGAGTHAFVRGVTEPVGILDVDTPRVGFDVGKDDSAPVYALHCAGENVRWHDHLVAGADAQGVQREAQGDGAVVSARTPRRRTGGPALQTVARRTVLKLDRSSRCGRRRSTIPLSRRRATGRAVGKIGGRGELRVSTGNSEVADDHGVDLESGAQHSLWPAGFLPVRPASAARVFSIIHQKAADCDVRAPSWGQGSM